VSSISYLRLDPSYDPIFDPSVALTDLQAVEQAIKTRLLLFQGEWWENLNVGLPLFQSILGKRNLQAIQLAITAVISQTPFVSAVLSIQANLDDANRAYSFTATVQTQFGIATVSVPLPGSVGSVGS
jgi:hypothetical protein